MSYKMPKKRRDSKDSSILIVLALFVMICGAVLLAIPTTSTAFHEEKICVEDVAVQQAFRAVLEANIALNENNQGQARIQLQTARQALTEALDP